MTPHGLRCARLSLLALALSGGGVGCVTLGASVGGTIDGGGRVEWVGQGSFGMNAFPSGSDRITRVMIDTRFYSLDHLAHVGVAMGADVVERPREGAGRHVGARLGMGGQIDSRAPSEPNPPDVRLSFEAGAAWGVVDRNNDRPDGLTSASARTLGPTLELILHSKARRWSERAALGARASGEVALWLPRETPAR